MSGKFLDDVLGATVGPTFSGHRLEHKRAAEWNTTLYRGGVGVGGVCGMKQGANPIRGRIWRRLFGE